MAQGGDGDDGVTADGNSQSAGDADKAGSHVTSNADTATTGLTHGCVEDIISRVKAAATSLGLEGSVVPFGSYVHGLQTTYSDCDLSYMREDGKSEPSSVKILQMFAAELSAHGFENVIGIFQANTPLVKAVDASGIEVDLCIENRLGRRNSLLIAAYCNLDPRVSELGIIVKKWAKAFELVGSSDGHLNSYAYTLMVIYYLMKTDPPVVPNLQDLASGKGTDPVIVKDHRWGYVAECDCRFWEDIHLLPPSKNTSTVDTLFIGVLRFYAGFDWLNKAVSIRLGLTDHANTSKMHLYTAVLKDQWYIEDPFDLRLNLASQCTREGRQRILDHMRRTLQILNSCPNADLRTRSFASHCSRSTTVFLLKCRVQRDKVSASDFVEALRGPRDLNGFTVRFPRSTDRVCDAFIVFKSEKFRRTVHELNETYVGDWQLRLLPCSSWALQDALLMGDYDEIEVLPRESQEEVKAGKTTSNDSRLAQGRSETKPRDDKLRDSGGEAETEDSNDFGKEVDALAATASFVATDGETTLGDSRSSLGTLETLVDVARAQVDATAVPVVTGGTSTDDAEYDKDGIYSLTALARDFVEASSPGAKPKDFFTPTKVDGVNTIGLARGPVARPEGEPDDSSNVMSALD